mmetsp:Transcript_2930/g.7330  ORF Transcript_2930/g.7330 Transcript_2930/m.7330 type:complete len:104 (-) Transcript_2930:87-398(-)
MSGSWLDVPSVEAPLPRNVAKPSTDQIYNLLRAEREVEVRARITRERANNAGKGGANGARNNNGGPLPPLGLRTYPNRQGVAVQIEDEGAAMEDDLVSHEVEQ